MWSACVAIRWKSTPRNDSSVRTAAASFTWCAFITLQPVRRAASRQYAGPSSPWSWSIVSEQRSASAATSSSGALTKTPTISARRLSALPISSAAAGSHARGLSGWKIRPIAQAPASAASRASSSRVTPQTLTRVMSASPGSSSCSCGNGRRAPGSNRVRDPPERSLDFAGLLRNLPVGEAKRYEIRREVLLITADVLQALDRSPVVLEAVDLDDEPELREPAVHLDAVDDDARLGHASTPYWSASLTARSSRRSVSVAAMSTIVAAGVVTGMP